MESVGDQVEEAAVALDGAIRAELSSIAKAIRDAAERATRLGDSGRGANGLKAASATWARDLEVVAGKVEEEGPEVSKALLGKGMPEIVTHVNPELAAVAASDPTRRKP